MTCPFTRKPDSCIRRQSWIPQPSDCRICDFRGRKPEDETKPPSAATERARPTENNDLKEKEEVKTVVAEKRELIMRVIEKAGTVTRGELCQGVNLLKSEVEPIAKALAAEGKIKVWPGSRSDSVIYTTPDHPDPMAGKKKAAPAKVDGNPRTPARRAKRVPVTGRNVARNKPPKNGARTADAEPVAAALADLLARRKVIDDAIEALKKLA